MTVGVEKYAEGLPDAQFAENDARAVREHLLALGVPERNMKFLVGPRALLSALSAYLEEWLPRNAKEDSRVFVYFSGLGALKARQLIVALDSCFSGAGGRSVLAEGARPLVAKVDAAPAAGGKLIVPAR